MFLETSAMENTNFFCRYKGGVEGLLCKNITIFLGGPYILEILQTLLTTKNCGKKC